MVFLIWDKPQHVGSIQVLGDRFSLKKKAIWVRYESFSETQARFDFSSDDAFAANALKLLPFA